MHMCMYMCMYMHMYMCMYMLHVHVLGSSIFQGWLVLPPAL